MSNIRTILKVLGWIWLTLILPFAWISIQVIEQLQRKGFPQNLYDTTLGFLFLPGWPIILTCSLLALLLLATIVVGIMAFRSNQDETPASATIGPVTTNVAHSSQGSASHIGDNAVIIQNSPGAVYNPHPQLTRMKQAETRQNVLLHRFLKSVIARSENVNPTGIHQPSPAMLSISVPLQEIFIHIHAVSDRPQFNILPEEKELMQEIEKLRQRKDLDESMREDYIQRLRAALSSHNRDFQILVKPSTIDITIETVLQELTPAKPVAVMLGGPGSGKSTTMLWLALHMARALCDSGYHLPDGLPAAQLPILIPIGDYAKTITATSSTPQPISSIKDYLWAEFKKFDGALPALIEEHLAAGRCLLLLDGLDEVASDDLRRRVAQDLFNFITSYLVGQQNIQDFNRVLVTSRIFGYEPGPFAHYAQYTLLDLDDEQIWQFLDSWCPAAERYRVRSGQSMKETLTEQQEQEAWRIGSEQRALLLDALQQNPGIRRLAVNPLMLTILALIQKSNRTLPHRRIELYETVTLTLLDNWNQLKGGKMFSPEEIDLAEHMLSEFAFRMHITDLPLVKEDVLCTAREIMAEFYQRSVDEIAPRTVEHFIDTLQSSSSLFIERGQGLFGFIHRTFQEYYVMLYLVDKKHYPTSEALVTFVQENCHIPIWHEPLLLLIAYKSERRDRDEQQQATAIIQTILDTSDELDPYLHRNLLLAASAIVDCKAWIIDKPLQRDIANQLLDIYGDTFGWGRYTELQKDIEKITLLWLRGQPTSSSQQPPLLESFYTALCDHSGAQRQLGAAKLFAKLAPDLPTCPDIVRHTLVPPLLHLAGVQSWYSQELSCPPEISTRLSATSAHPSSPEIEDYALVTLRLLDTNGPAGWLHADWLRWSKQRPELLERLTQHSLELNSLIVPVAFPAKPDDPNWDRQLVLSKNWQQHAQHSSGALQMQFLQASNTALYPYAILFKRLLAAEQAVPTIAWQTLWERILQEEMQQGRTATYQPALNLRLLLAHDDQQHHRRLAFDLLNELMIQETHVQALITLTILYMRDTLDMRNVLDMLVVHDMLDMLNIREMHYMKDLLDLRNIRYQRDLGNLRKLRNLLDQVQILQLLGDGIENTAAELLSPRLFALYAVLYSIEQIPPSTVYKVQSTITSLEGRGAGLSVEQRHLLSVIKRRFIGATGVKPLSRITSSETPDQHITELYRLQQLQPELSRSHAEELLNACTDTRKPSEKIWKKLDSKEIWKKLDPNKWEWLFSDDYETSYRHEFSNRKEVDSIGRYAWRMLSQAWNMNRDVQQFVVQMLDDDHALICAAAALLLQGCRDLAPEMKQAASVAITHILSDDELSHRPLDPPDDEFTKIWRLDDVLFETLRLLAER